MLSRGNSEASARLRRAKSSSSIKTRRSLLFEPHTQDSSAAKGHALAAASHAFGRATTSDLGTNALQEVASQQKTLDPERHLSRSRSIRFAGPNAVPTRELPITVRAAPTSLIDFESRPRSFHTDLRRNNSSIQGDDGFITALPSHGEYVETRVASQPSSYRRLRKSKSMFSARASSTKSSNTLRAIALDARANAGSAAARPRQAQVHAGSRLGRSFSFLGPYPEHISSDVTNGTAIQNEAVGLARDQYLRQLERQRIDGAQGVGGRSPTRQQPQKTFRKTVRTSSSHSHGSAVDTSGSLWKERHEQQGVSGKARAISLSFKNRLRRVFNKSSEVEGTLPVQHLQATRPHFGGTTPLASSRTQHQASDSLIHSTPDHDSSRQGDVLHGPGRRGSIVNSFRSADSDLDIDERTSRVTSWTNSTAADTINTLKGSERKRLSIIQENGTVEPRLGSLRRSATLQLDASGYRSQPRKSSLYAKLQQRMGRSNSVSRTHPSDIVVGDTSNIYKENLSVSFCDHSETNPIRKHRATEEDGVRPSTPIHPAQSSALEAVDPSSTPQTAEAMQKEVKIDEASNASSKRPLRESTSMFFPQSTRIERSRISPFREAMRSNGHMEQMGITNATYSSFEGREGASSMSAKNRTRDRSVARSESIYSRTSSGDSPQHHQNFKSLTGIVDAVGSQVAPLLSESNFEARELVAEPTCSKALATDSSVEVQSLASEQQPPLVIERSPHFKTGRSGPSKRTGHKREQAQIDGDDVNIGKLQLSASMFNGHSFSPVSLDVRSSFKNTSFQPMNDRFPLMSINAQTNLNHHERRAPANSSEAARYVSGTGDYQKSVKVEKTGENVRPKVSAANLIPPSSDLKAFPKMIERQNEKIEPHDTQKGSLRPTSTPISHSRSSPERIARLRRMYSNQNLGSPAPRKQFEASPKMQQYASYQQDRSIQGFEPDVIGLSEGFPDSHNESVLHSRKMVDTFLSNRRQSQGDDMEHTVFI